VIAELPERSELVLDTGLTYDGVTSIRVRVTKRDGRYRFSDSRGAIAAAGVDSEELTFPRRVPLGRYETNVTRRGEVWLPAFARQEQAWLQRVVSLVAEGSLLLYEALLESEPAGSVRSRRRRVSPTGSRVPSVHQGIGRAAIRSS
jgi:hypothetical protein